MNLFSFSTTAACLLSLGMCLQTAKADEWTVAEGKSGIDATFVELAGDTVKLQKADGTVLVVPLKWLSAESQQLAVKMAQAVNPKTAEQAMNILRTAFAAGKAHQIWQMMPEEYQDDLNGLLHSFAGTMDEAAWKDIVEVVKTAATMLKKQKTFIFEHPNLSTGMKDPKAFAVTYDEIVSAMEMLGASDVADLNKLKQMDMGVFLASTGEDIGTKLASLARLGDELHTPPTAKAVPGSDFILGNSKVATIEQNADQATLRFTTPSVDGEDKVEVTKFVKYKGKWMTREFVNTWDKGQKEMEGAFDNLGNSLPGLKRELATILKHLKQLNAASTAEEFDVALKQAALAFVQAVQARPANGAGK